MQLSTVKRERLIPPVYLLSIALLLAVAFIALLPSRENFAISPQASAEKKIDDLDVAYIRASNTSGTLPAHEMQSVISALIRGQRWRDARSLMADRPDVDIAEVDKFLLHLESARQGYHANNSAADKSSYAAELIQLLGDFLDNGNLHDDAALARAAEVSRELEQPELAASYQLMLANNDPQNAVKHLQSCAQILAQYDLNRQAESCYRTAIAAAHDSDENFDMSYRLVYFLYNTDNQFTALELLESLVHTAPRKIETLKRLAAQALELERPDLAYPLYAQLADLDSDRTVHWLGEAARWSEASNQPGLSAEYIANIIARSDEAIHEPLIERRQALLIAAGRNEEALYTVHSRIIDQPANAELLQEGITLASAVGLQAQALQWNERLLEIRPYDTQAMTRQIDLAMATKQLDNALHWSRTMAELKPSDQTVRVTLAQLEEWNGNVQQAQQQRMWLATHFPSQTNDFELLRLSELNWDSATAAKTLQRMGRREPLSRENILKLVQLYEADGRPERAARALRLLQKGSNDPMPYRELAALHKRHRNWEKSLRAWQVFARKFGRSSEESINRMELHWRLRQTDQALTLAHDVSEVYLASATPYQLELMTELGWRYRKPDLVLAAAPYLELSDIDDGKRLQLSRKIVQSHLDNDDAGSAVEYAEWAWRSSGDDEFLNLALDIALREDVYPHSERYLDASDELLALRELPDYWLAVASYNNKHTDTQAALASYEQALMKQPKNPQAMTGILWSLMSMEPIDEQRLADTLDKFQVAAVDEPELWSPFAIAHLRLSDAEGSLRWFSKVMLQDEHDYNMLLSFADALEQSGNAPHAFKVRQYTLNQLRPLVLAKAGNQTDAIARDYIALLQRHGSAAENETWARRLLVEADNVSGEEQAWRQEMAAAWYLSSQQHDYARLIMTKMHEKRLQTPTWQQLAIAVADDDFNTIEEILASGKPLSGSDRILALRKVGNEKDAYQLARKTMVNGATAQDRRNATDHVIALRSSRPSYYKGGVSRKAIEGLEITESGLSLRHTLAAADLGVSVDYHRRTLTRSDANLINGNEDDLAVTVHFGNSLRGGSLTAGYSARDQDELPYTGGELYVRDRKGRKELSTEVYINEVTDSTEALRLAAKRDRAELTYSHSLGKQQYLRLSGSMDEILLRDTNQSLSTGMGASLELGTVRSIGSNSWSMGVIASQKNRSATGTVETTDIGTPIVTSYGGSFDSDYQELSLNASLFRGGINAEYPQAASPRYHVSARVGHNWPSESTAFTVSAGAGFRIVGNDELSFSVAHDSNSDPALNAKSNSTVGVQYTNHF